VSHLLHSQVVESVVPSDLSPRQVGRELRELIDAGCELRPAGEAKSDPLAMFSRGYTPRYKFRLFGTCYYLSTQRFDANFRFFVVYVIPGAVAGATPRAAYPRLFYKDQSLIWRCATHFIQSEKENWIGKGDLKTVVDEQGEVSFTAEETTDLPYEIQAAMDLVSRASGSPRRDYKAVPLVLRRAPDDRLEPYDDFLAPRRRAAADRRNLVHGGKYVAGFARPGDPASLRFVSGFEPDFGAKGVLEVARSKSTLYGGVIRRFRILSRNRKIQYLFVASPRMVWIIPPQTLTTELSSYGVRTIDANVDDDLCVPGYEYHFLDESLAPPALYSQIPAGFAGRASSVDPSRSAASPWLEKLPVVREFRRRVLDRRAGR
jgi:hypothetical protein